MAGNYVDQSICGGGGGAEAAEPGGHWGHVPPHFSPQSMKCPTSTGVHARPTMYQEGVPRGAIKIFLPRV